MDCLRVIWNSVKINKMKQINFHPLLNNNKKIMINCNKFKFGRNLSIKFTISFNIYIIISYFAHKKMCFSFSIKSLYLNKIILIKCFLSNSLTRT